MRLTGNISGIIFSMKYISWEGIFSPKNNSNRSSIPTGSLPIPTDFGHTIFGKRGNICLLYTSDAADE